MSTLTPGQMTRLQVNIKKMLCAHVMAEFYDDYAKQIVAIYFTWLKMSQLHF